MSQKLLRASQKACKVKKGFPLFLVLWFIVGRSQHTQVSQHKFHTPCQPGISCCHLSLSRYGVLWPDPNPSHLFPTTHTCTHRGALFYPGGIYQDERRGGQGLPKEQIKQMRGPRSSSSISVSLFPTSTTIFFLFRNLSP